MNSWMNDRLEEEVPCLEEIEQEEEKEQEKRNTYFELTRVRLSPQYSLQEKVVITACEGAAEESRICSEA